MEKELKFLLYSTPQENVKIDVAVKDETIWLTQKAMAALFDTSRENITMHLKNLFESTELQEDSVCKKFLLTAADGKNYNTQFYNLDAIISIGYRVNSDRATKFRIWATQILKEYITKGFAMNDELLKQGKAVFGKDYYFAVIQNKFHFAITGQIAAEIIFTQADKNKQKKPKPSRNPLKNMMSLTRPKKLFLTLISILQD